MVAKNKNILEYLSRVIGPPGCGKTTYLGRQVQLAWEAGNEVMVCSLTRTAAAEVAGRDLPIPRECVGTLHSQAWRRIRDSFLGIAETPKYLGEWNLDYPDLALSGGERDLEEDNGAPLDGQMPGDDACQSMNLLRARLVDPDHWPILTRAFANRWDEWKKANDLCDFTDMLEIALDGQAAAPGNPQVIFADECQDFSALEMNLLLKWGAEAGRLVVVGDPWQALYQWRGSDPEVFFSGEAADHRLLGQSYRVPRVVHAAALKWMESMPGYEPIDYLPTGEEGLIGALEGTWRESKALLPLIIDKIEQGKSTMVLASCAYMLQGILKMLREEGIPFGNSYRCSPPDELILTNLGYVPIAELDPQIHRLPGFIEENNALTWGPHWRIDGSMRPSGPQRKGEPRGFTFSKGCRPYHGELITITTEQSQTRVTPNHRVRVRMSKRIQGKWLVYLMRRGHWWRIGMTRASSKHNNIGGVSNRLSGEHADGAWVLSIHDTRNDAIREESWLQAEYGITGLRFEAPGLNSSLTTPQLHTIHERLESQAGRRAAQLLTDRGLLLDSPLYVRNGVRDRRSGCYWAFETVAANLLSNFMDMPVVPKAFEQMGHLRTIPEWELLTIERQNYDGLIYSLDVPGPEHYISGRAIVHNSKNGAWNPLKRRGGSISSCDRLTSFLRMGEEGFWTREDMETWLSGASCSKFLPSAESWQKFEPRLANITGEIPYGLAEVLVGADAIEASMSNDLEWYRNTLAKARQAPAVFPCAIAKRYGSEMLQKEPLVTVGTIHSVKGGEADTVIVAPDLSQRGVQSWGSGQEGKAAIYRLMYVACTRAKQELHIMKPVVPSMAVRLI